jgi:hypothetical protein
MKKSDTPFMDDKAVGLPDSKDVYEDIFQGNSLMAFLDERFSRAEDLRQRRAVSLLKLQRLRR